MVKVMVIGEGGGSWRRWGLLEKVVLMVVVIGEVGVEGGGNW